MVSNAKQLIEKVLGRKITREEYLHNFVNLSVKEAIRKAKRMRKTQTLVVCYNCRRLVPKKEAFYIYLWDAYYCPRCYKELLDGKPVRKPNVKRCGV